MTNSTRELFEQLFTYLLEEKLLKAYYVNMVTINEEVYEVYITNSMIYGDQDHKFTISRKAFEDWQKNENKTV
jgi:mannitol/fructose-specific phosphotransferase system IIA component (Ntr-type)